jgi:hypothetical protein
MWSLFRRPNGKHFVRNKNGMVQNQTRRELKALIKMESFEMFFIWIGYLRSRVGKVITCNLTSS